MRLLIVSFTLSLVLSAPATADVFAFDTPSGNIACSVGLSQGSSDIECTIYERSGPLAAPALASCAAGHKFTMFDRGGVSVSCGGRFTGRAFEEAPYGVTGRFGGFVCESETTGLTCTNEDGHGFFLSRRSQRVF
jgi:hypothetical protein